MSMVQKNCSSSARLRFMHRAGRVRRGAALSWALMLGFLLLPATGCSVAHVPVPHCEADPRLGIVAQSVPTAVYLPCVRNLPAGWQVTQFGASRGQTRFDMLSDRADGRPVVVMLRPSCDVSRATVQPARAEGVRSYLQLRSVTPRYAGTHFDVFPGGCVTYRFDLPRGPHIPLLEDVDQSTALVSRRDLRIYLHRTLGVELNP